MRTWHLFVLSTVAAMLSCQDLRAANLNLNKGIFVLKSGDYQLEITSECKYTMRSIRYNGILIGTPSGFYGTVLYKGSGKYSGSGHTEAGEEEVLSAELVVDENPVVMEPGKVYEGEKIVLRKRARIDKLIISSSLVLNADGITEKKSFEAEEDQQLSDLYIFMYCFTHKTSEWAAMLPDGRIVSDTFKNDKQFLIKQDVKWAAQFDAADGTGMLVYYPEIIKGKTHKTCFWDIPGAYHKYYLMIDVPKVIEKGFKSQEMTVIIKGFQAEQSTWKDDVKNLAAAIN